MDGPVPIEDIPFDRPDWLLYALCAVDQIDVDLFFPRDEMRGQDHLLARDYCNRCPVRFQCLAYALHNREEGIWGGTSTDERYRLRKNRSRAHCPVCSAAEVARDETGQSPWEVCIACGSSWKADGPSAHHLWTLTDPTKEITT